MGAFINTAVSFQICVCRECGIPFGVMADMLDVRIEDGSDVHCPNGHANRFLGETGVATGEQGEILKLRHELDQAEARARDAEAKSRRKGVA